MGELNSVSQSNLASGLVATALFVGAMAIGSALGLSNPDMGDNLSIGIDPTLLTMICLLFFEVRLNAVLAGFGNLRFIALAWAANFLFIPIIGFAIASFFLSGQPLFYTGLLIYFLAPCTDWVLGFTRMARGDTALGAALLPINLLTQLLLFPLWLLIFTPHTGFVDFESIPGTLFHWFFLPFVAAQILRWGLARLLEPHLFEKICEIVAFLIPIVIAMLILQIFASNVSVIMEHRSLFGIALLAVFCFFLVTYVLGEALTGLFKLPYGHHALLTMTTAARNAPLMLAVTSVAIPNQPLIYVALIIGMLVEFPHLILLKQVLLGKFARLAKHSVLRD